MRFPVALAGAVSIAMSLGGCAVEQATSGDDALVNAGFTKVRTAEMLNAARGKPPHKFLSRTVGGVTTYYWYDPVSCGCVYQGDAAAYARFRQYMAGQASLRASLNADQWEAGQGGNK
jgi:hypothetical protein